MNTSIHNHSVKNINPAPKAPVVASYAYNFRDEGAGIA
jgi:hypothetical protein